jgi:transcriptional regulator with XRE-family HTH domain
MPYPIATSWKVLRVIVGLSQAELSKQTGIKQARLSAIELGRDDPTADEEMKLSEALAWQSPKAAP